MSESSSATTGLAPSRRKKREVEGPARTNLSSLDRKRTSVKAWLNLTIALVLAILSLVALGPLLWLAKSAISATADIVQQPYAWFPSGVQWENLYEAWTKLRVGKYTYNTFVLMFGDVFFGLLVSLTGGFGIAVLKPKYAKVVFGAVLACLFIPGVVSLVSQYLTVLDMPILGWNLVNTYWAIWLPGAASAFNVLLISRFFSGLSLEIMEAAKIDGAGPFRLFWSIALPMSRPIVGVIALLIAVNAFDGFLWPMLVLPDSNLHPIAVGIFRASESAEQSLLMAGMFISVIAPILIFLAFQRQFLRNAGQAGALKG